MPAGALTSIFVIFCLIGVNAGFFHHFYLGRQFKIPTESEDGDHSQSDKWITQRLDHFNDAELRTWQQRYFINDSFYEPGGPAFVMIGGEGPASITWMTNGQWINWAQEFHAICFQLEHRYYGKSHPTKDASVKNLQFLSSEQALADLAQFRSAMAEEHNLEDAKWIFFGGSYSGSLAAWVRLKYPHLVTGAVASSAPLRAEVDFKEYIGVVNDSLTSVSSTCVSAIETAVSQIDVFLNEGKLGWDTLRQKFQLCDALDGNKSADVANLFSILCGNVEEIVQYNKDNRAFEGVAGTDITIDTICGIMDNSTIGSEIDRYAAVNNLVLNVRYNQSCLDFSYHKMIDNLRNSSWDSSGVLSGTRQWTYQTCTEFGFFQSSDLKNQPFGSKFPISFFVDQCADIYGPKFNASVVESGAKQTNIIYGGQDIQVTKVVFPNGSIDPWHYLGLIRNSTSTDMITIYIQGTAHCADIYPSSESDPPELVEARKVIRDNISKWIT